MIKTFKTDSFWRSVAVSTVAAFALSACNNADSGSGTTAAAQGAFEVEGDHAIGNPDAPVTVVEYASVTCGACANWHNTVNADFKKKYVDTGKVRFVFREFPTPPADLARAGFLIANCAPADKFMANIGLQFKRQRAILTSSDVRQEYINVAKAAGLSEAEFEACLANTEENERLDAVEQAAMDAGVTGTPAFFINGKREKVFTLDSFDEVLGPLLGEAPEAAADAPAETETETTE